MRRGYRIALIALSIGFCPDIAIAATCTVPEIITNGQIADATKVMDNFEAVAACTEDAITSTGSPSTASIAVFSSPQTVASGDLTGDVTTSGGTVTELAATGVTPGNYSSANITVDAKGRIVAAANGSGSGSGGWSLVSHVTISTPVPSVEFTGLGVYNELMIYGSQVTASTSGQRVVLVSVNNGSSYYSASGNYYTLQANGTRSSGTALIYHNSATTSARDFFGQIAASNVSGVPKVARNIDDGANYHRGFAASLLPIDALQVKNNLGGNLTSGDIYLLAR